MELTEQGQKLLYSFKGSTDVGTKTKLKNTRALCCTPFSMNQNAGSWHNPRCPGGRHAHLHHRKSLEVNGLVLQNRGKSIKRVAVQWTPEAFFLTVCVSTLIKFCCTDSLVKHSMCIDLYYYCTDFPLLVPAPFLPSATIYGMTSLSSPKETISGLIHIYTTFLFPKK